MELNEVQKKIGELYCGGDLSHVSNMDDAENCGDTLFLFLMRESEDVSKPEEFLERLRNACDQLEALRFDIAEEVNMKKRSKLHP